MASSYFLYGQFEEVLVYLNSIKSFFVNDDTFNYNYGQVKKPILILYFTTHLYLYQPSSLSMELVDGGPHCVINSRQINFRLLIS